MKNENSKDFESDLSVLSGNTENELNHYSSPQLKKEKNNWGRYFYSPFVIGLTSLGVSILLLNSILNNQLNNKFEGIANTKINYIDNEIDKYNKLLNSISVLIEANKDSEIKSVDFYKYANSVMSSNDYPSFIRFDYVALVENKNLPIFYQDLIGSYNDIAETKILTPELKKITLNMIEKNKIISEKKERLNKNNVIIKYSYPLEENKSFIGDEYIYLEPEVFENIDDKKIFSSYTFRGVGLNNTNKSYKLGILKRVKDNINNGALSLTISFNDSLFENKDSTSSQDLGIQIFSSEKDGKRIVYKNKNNISVYDLEKYSEIKIGSEIYTVKITSEETIYNNDYWKYFLSILAFNLLITLIILLSKNKENEKNILDNKAIEEIEGQLRVDDLTKLLNRRACQQDLRQLVTSYKEMNKKSELVNEVNLIFIDLDGFKRINDTLGHSYGDLVLIEYSKRLSDLLNNIEGISLYRLGGDEFTVILNNNAKEELEDIVKQIFEITKEPFYLKKDKYYITQSMGIASFPNNAWNTESLLKNADLAMYEAKKQGKNNYIFFNKKISEDVNKKNKVINSIKEALEKKEFYMMYQPKFKHIEDGKYVCSGVEALIRWENNKLGNVQPNIFIPLVEENGFIEDITKWIVEEICKECSILKSINNFHISINLSAKQLSNLNLANEITEITNKYGLKNNMFVVEITETTMMKEPELAKKSLNKFKELGFKISVDDFGTGYSSLSYLRNFPIDELKIDKSFSDMILEDKHTQVIVEGIISMCEKLDMSIVVEGIEKIDQIKWFEVNKGKNQHIEIQGYYFAKPMRVNDLIDFCFKKI